VEKMSSIRSAYIAPLLLTGLLAVCLFSFAGYMALFNNPSNDITQNPAVSQYLTSLNRSLDKVQAISENSSDALYGSETDTGGGFIILTAITGIWQAITSTPTQVFKLTTGLLQNTILGGDTYYLILGVVGGLMIITLIMLVWRWLRTA